MEEKLNLILQGLKLLLQINLVGDYSGAYSSVAPSIEGLVAEIDKNLQTSTNENIKSVTIVTPKTESQPLPLARPEPEQQPRARKGLFKNFTKPKKGEK